MGFGLGVLVVVVVVVVVVGGALVVGGSLGVAVVVGAVAVVAVLGAVVVGAAVGSGDDVVVGVVGSGGVVEGSVGVGSGVGCRGRGGDRLRRPGHAGGDEHATGDSDGGEPGYDGCHNRAPHSGRPHFTAPSSREETIGGVPLVVPKLRVTAALMNPVGAAAEQPPNYSRIRRNLNVHSVPIALLERMRPHARLGLSTAR